MLSTLASMHVGGTSRQIDSVSIVDVLTVPNSMFAETGEVQQPTSANDTAETNKALSFSVESSGYSLQSLAAEM